jgi:tetratricopeptide (TPR) repeat protein
MEHKHDLSAATNFYEISYSLAVSTRNARLQSQSLAGRAWIKWHLGDYPEAQRYAFESQRVNRISADLFREARALLIEAACWIALGNYRQSISGCNRARDLLVLCGMSGGDTDHAIMTCQAEVHKFKSEYIEARNIHGQILGEASPEQDPYNHGLALHNITEIEVCIGVPKDDVQKSIDKVQTIFQALGSPRLLQLCDVLQADLNLREGDSLAAMDIYRESLNVSWGKNSEIVACCLERLGDVNHSSCLLETSSWTTVFLVHALRSKEKLGIHKALQFFGDLLLTQGDRDTAISLFTVALEGFTYMDIHRSRAECMFCLGLISWENKDHLRAAELWQTARPLFQRSSQAKQVENIDERLAALSRHVLVENQKHLAPNSLDD